MMAPPNSLTGHTLDWVEKHQIVCIFHGYTSDRRRRRRKNKVATYKYSSDFQSQLQTCDSSISFCHSWLCFSQSYSPYNQQTSSDKSIDKFDCNLDRKNSFSRLFIYLSRHWHRRHFLARRSIECMQRQ